MKRVPARRILLGTLCTSPEQPPACLLRDGAADVHLHDYCFVPSKRLPRRRDVQHHLAWVDYTEAFHGGTQPKGAADFNEGGDRKCLCDLPPAN